jgi:hypothetical protein
MTSFDFGPWIWTGSDVGLAEGDVDPGAVRDPERPQQHVAVGERQPDVILAEPQQHGIVDDAAVGRGDEHVLALPYLALGEVARDEHVCEGKGARSGDRDLALNAHVAQRHALEQLPVLGDRIAVMPGVVHVVVDAVHRHAVAMRGIKERRLADPGVQKDLRVLDDRRQGGTSTSESKSIFRHGRDDVHAATKAEETWSTTFG